MAKAGAGTVDVAVGKESMGDGYAWLLLTTFSWNESVAEGKVETRHEHSIVSPIEPSK